LPLLLPLFVPTRHSGAARISVLALAVALAVVCSNSSFWRSQNLCIGPCRCSCSCFSDGAGGFSPLNKANRIKRL
jgi:hypothetical protein